MISKKGFKNYRRLEEQKQLQVENIVRFYSDSLIFMEIEVVEKASE